MVPAQTAAFAVCPPILLLLFLFNFFDIIWMFRLLLFAKIGLHSGSQRALNRSPDLSLRQVIISLLSSTSQAMEHSRPTSELVAGVGVGVKMQNWGPISSLSDFES